MKNDNYIVFILDILQQPVNVKVSDDDVLKMQEFLRYLRVTAVNRKYDVVTMLEERFGINERQKTTLQVIANNRGIKQGFASGLICELIKEIRNKYRDFFETFYNGESDRGFFIKKVTHPLAMYQ